MRVYLCGAMDGCTDEQASAWRTCAEFYLGGHGIVCLNPMDRDYRDREVDDTELVEEDKIDIEMSDVVLVNYEFVGEGENTGAGSNMEIILAWMKDKRVVVYCPPGKPRSSWVKYHSHKIYDTLKEALDHIVEYKQRLET